MDPELDWQQTAAVHAQLKLPHLLKEGNGRIGRILIPLLLYQKRALSQPMFYLSQYLEKISQHLEKNRDEYYLHLNHISEKNDWNGWLAFFLRAVSEQAAQNSRWVIDIKVRYTASLLRQLRDAGILLELEPASGQRPAVLDVDPD